VKLATYLHLLPVLVKRELSALLSRIRGMNAGSGTNLYFAQLVVLAVNTGYDFVTVRWSGC